MSFDRYNQPQSYQSVGLGAAAVAGADALDRTDINVGLRDHMLRIYRYLGLGVGVTGVATWLLTAVYPELLLSTMSGIMPLVFAFLPLGFFLLIGGMFNRLSAGGMTALYMVFAVLMAFPTAVLTFIADSTGNASAIAQAFFATAATFAAMSFIGYTTKRDLSAFAKFFLVALIGILILSLLNVFLIGSFGLMYFMSIAIVLIFAGLVAFDTQRLKRQYLEHAGYADGATLNKLAILGAAELYFDVIVIFRTLLFLFMSSDD